MPYRPARLPDAIAFRRVAGSALSSVVVVIALSGCATSSELGGPGVHTSNVHTVTAGVLVRGGQPDLAGLEALKARFGVATVVNLNDTTAASEAALCRKANLTYVALPGNPFRPDRAKLERFLAIVNDPARKGAVYVHCQAGMDRTGVAVAAYRVVLQGWDGDRANDELREWQAWTHRVLFLEIPGFVRSIDRDRSAWLADVKAIVHPAA